jgi:hypothetical protein
MKKLLSCLVIGICTIESQAQNVGIKTNNPQATLDVRGSQRVGGNSNYIQYDSLTGRIQWIGAALYAPASQQIIRHSNSAEGLYAGGGRLEYRNVTDPVFYSDWTNGNGYFKNNLGISNLDPQFPLSFSGALGDKISLWTDGSATHYGLGVQSNLLQMFTKTSLDDIAFGFGSSTAFTERMRIKGNGLVGIGNANPYSPLTFASDIGAKISLFGNSSSNYGLGVANGLLRIYSDAAGSDIGFGYYNGNSFFENMRVTGTGNLGIGVIPTYTLDIRGRMRIRSNGAGVGTSGIWLDNTLHTTAAFVGMEDDSHVGFFGGAGWALSMNTGTGALKINGNEGNAGQVLQSNGNGFAPSWSSGTNTLYNNTLAVTSNTLLSSPGGGFQLPGMTYTFAATTNGKAYVSYTIPIHSNACGGCSGSTIFTDIVMDGILMNRIENDIPATAKMSISASKIISFAAGSHTIVLNGSVSGSSITINPCCIFETNMNLQIIPQN